MSKKLLSAMLALVMVLSMLPLHAFAAEGQTEDIIKSVGFAYRRPTITPQDDENKNETVRWEKFYALRNVFVVWFKTPVTDKEKYSFAVKAKDAEEYTPVDTYYYTGMQPTITGSTAAYFEAPAGVLNADKTTYTIKVTETGSNDYQEQDITLLKATLKKSGTENLERSNFAADDAQHVQEDNGVCSIFVERGDTYIYLPNLKDGIEGGGSSADRQFVGWASEQGADKADAFSQTPLNSETTFYAVFGVKPVSGFVLTGTEPETLQAFPESNQTGFTTDVDYGAAAGKPITIYIVNKGNQNLGNVNSEKGFYVVSKVTDHFTLEFRDNSDDGGSRGVTKFEAGGTDKYVITAGSNANKTPAVSGASYLVLNCTPKGNLNAGTYTDKLVISTPDRLITQVTLTVEVKPTEVTVEMGTIEKEYGQVVRLDENGKWNDKNAPAVTLSGSSSGTAAPTFKDLELSLSNYGFNAKADVKAEEYAYTVDSCNRNYQVTVNGGITVKQAAPEGKAGVTATAIKVGQKLADSVLSGAFVNPYNKEAVEGTLEWTDANKDEAVSLPQGGNITGNWIFKPANSTNYKTVEDTVSVVVSDRMPTTIHLNTNTHRETVTFDGEQHQLEAYVTYKGDNTENTLADAEITYQYRKHEGTNDDDHSASTGEWSDGWPIEAGVWDIKVDYAGETGTYAPAEAIFHLTIEPRTLTVSPTVESKTYDGTTNATVRFALSGRVSGYDVGVSSYDAHFNDANAGDDKTVEITNITLSSANYKLTSETFHARSSIKPVFITLTVKDGAALTKNYGEVYEFVKDSFDAAGLAGGETISDLNVEFASDGAAFDAVVDDYPVTATVSGGNYKLTSSDVGTLSVERADLLLSQAPTVTNGYQGGNKDFVQIIDGVVVNKYNPDMVVTGTWRLVDATGTFDAEETATLHWEFKPEDIDNYEDSTLDGEVTVTVLKKQPVKLEVKADTALTVTYDGQIHELKASDFETEESAVISVTHNEVPKDVGAYQIIVTATPTGDNTIDRDTAKIEVTLNITQATVQDPNWSFHGREGTALSALEQLPATVKGVGEDEINGNFQWEVPDATITDENGSTHNWIFTHENPNYVNPVTGSARVDMDADTRTVSAAVYNLPTGDYAVVDTGAGENKLDPGEKVVFYRDAACTDPVSGETEVPAENNGKFTVPLDNDALTAEGGALYAKIVGKTTEAKEVAYLPELGFTLPFDMVLLHVKGEPETVKVAPTDTSYKIESDAWTVAGDGVNFVEVTDNNDGSATFDALAAGTTTVTVSINFYHPDPAKTGETVTVIKELPLNITRHYVVFIEQVENGTATATPAEADANQTVTVTLTADSDYQASGLKVYQTGTDGKADEDQPVKTSGSGSSYTFTMPASDVILVPEFTEASAGGGGDGGDSGDGGGGLGGGGSFGGGSLGGGGFGGGTFVPSAPKAPTLKPEATADASGEAKASVTSAEVESAVEEARKNGAGEIVIEPQVTGNASKVSVELEKKSVDAMADSSDVDLTVKTDTASVTLPDDSLASLAAGTGSSVAVSVKARADGAVDIEVAIDGKAVDSLPGGIKVELPKASGGNVLVIVGADGFETIVKKSIVENGHAYALLDGSCTVKAVDNIITFADVTSTDWYSDAVDFAGSHELFKGVGENNFAPNTAMTRGMFATVLWRFESGEPVDTKSAFADVAEGDWYAEGVAWASEHKIINGYNQNTFAPADNVTREQLATMLYRYAVDIGLDVSAGGSLKKFSDSGSVSSYAKEALEWAVGAGLIKGNTDNTINPAGGAKRAEVATIFMRFCEMITK